MGQEYPLNERSHHEVNLIWRYLAAVNGSGVFGTGARVSQLLHYLVEEELAGRGERLQPYAVGVDGLGKPESFDPSRDSSVRVAMHSLRRALRTYNAANPKGAVHITIPPGSYRPVFEFRLDGAVPPAVNAEVEDLAVEVEPGPASARTAAAEPNSGPQGKLAGERLGRISGWLRRPSGAGITAAVVLGMALLAYALAWSRGSMGEDPCDDARPHLKVEMRGPQSVTSDKIVALIEEYLGYYPIVEQALGEGDKCGAPNFTLVLTPGSQAKDSGSSFTAQLTANTDQKIRWLRFYEPVSNPYYPETQLMAAQIAFDVGHGTGAIASIGGAPEFWTNAEALRRFQCLVAAHRYFVTESRQGLDNIIACSKRLIPLTRHADILGLFAALQGSQLVLASVPQRDLPIYNDLIDIALDRARELSPNDKELLIVTLRAMRKQRPMNLPQITRTMQAMERNLPMEPHILNQIAIAYSVSLGDYDMAWTYSEKSVLIGGEYGSSIVPRAFFYLVHEDWKKASTYTEALVSNDFPFQVATALCIAHKTGDQTRERRARAKLATMGYRTRAEFTAPVVETYRATKAKEAILRCFADIADTPNLPM